jgi:hypothetical protein|eukprot:SM010315S09139  [mRNA]  locus=s10315:303:320:+ [translate_table: standard]
MSALS